MGIAVNIKNEATMDTEVEDMVVEVVITADFKVIGNQHVTRIH